MADIPKDGIHPELIHYNIAYSSMPHTWILECLKLYEIKSLHQEIDGGVKVAQISIKCNINQGNDLSPLLIYIQVNALSEIITKSGLIN